MTEEPHAQPPPQEPPPDPDPMPRWVPVAIGVVLVTLATLAVVTGLRYRENTLVDMVRPRGEPPRADAPAPPGEPEAGASRLFSGRGGANVPPAHEPVGGDSRAEISGGPAGITAVVRMRARRGMQVRAEPSDAVVYVNEVPVGRAREFDSPDEVYDFAEPGSYSVRIAAPGFRDRHFLVTATDDAVQDVVRIEARLERE
ncbi:MAG TPA: PEGA domain-containing protein [Thermoanaerobaculia bacterium]|nr:PEGA domain-containing protein [Thermoanaerobaculia bacterium]